MKETTTNPFVAIYAFFLMVGATAGFINYAYDIFWFSVYAIAITVGFNILYSIVTLIVKAFKNE